jgi:hypothetical protein
MQQRCLRRAAPTQLAQCGSVKKVPLLYVGEMDLENPKIKNKGNAVY